MKIKISRLNPLEFRDIKSLIYNEEKEPSETLEKGFIKVKGYGSYHYLDGDNYIGFQKVEEAYVDDFPGEELYGFVFEEVSYYF